MGIGGKAELSIHGPVIETEEMHRFSVLHQGSVCR